MRIGSQVTYYTVSCKLHQIFLKTERGKLIGIDLDKLYAFIEVYWLVFFQKIIKVPLHQVFQNDESFFKFINSREVVNEASENGDAALTETGTKEISEKGV